MSTKRPWKVHYLWSNGVEGTIALPTHAQAVERASTIRSTGHWHPRLRNFVTIYHQGDLTRTQAAALFLLRYRGSLTYLDFSSRTLQALVDQGYARWASFDTVYPAY